MNLRHGFRVWVVNVKDDKTVHVLRDSKRTTVFLWAAGGLIANWLFGFLAGWLL